MVELTPVLLGTVRPGDFVTIVSHAVARKSSHYPTFFGVSDREVNNPRALCDIPGVVLAMTKANMISEEILPSFFSSDWTRINVCLPGKRFNACQAGNKTSFCDDTMSMVIYRPGVLVSSELTFTIGHPDAVVYKAIL